MRIRTASSAFTPTANSPPPREYCESFGHDLLTGATTGETDYKATVQPGKAWLKALDYSPPHEEPDADYPLRYTTGRTAYHFHTRTKTGRSRRLNDAAPEPWIEMSVQDAASAGCKEGDIVRVTSRRGRLEVPVRVGDIRPGTVFAPFPLRVLGHVRRRNRPEGVRPTTARHPGGERTHHHRMGPGIQAAASSRTPLSGSKSCVAATARRRLRTPRHPAAATGAPA